MNDYKMDENMSQRKRNTCDTSMDQINWRVWDHDFSNSSTVTKASVDSGIEINNDSDGSNTVMQNDNNLSNSTMPNSFENMMELLLNHKLSRAIARPFNNEIYKTNSDTSCTIEEIDQPASSLSKDVLDWPFPNKQIFLNALPNTPVIDGTAPHKYITAKMIQQHIDTMSKVHLHRKTVVSNFNRFERARQHKNNLEWIRRANYERRLCLAARANSVTDVERMLNTGVSPNCKDKMGRTPLHIAARRGYSSVASVLLKYGADPKLCDIGSTTPLQATITCSDKSSDTLLDEAVSQPSSGFPFKITEEVVNFNTDDFKAKINNIADVCWSNVKKNNQEFDQQVEILSNVCSQLSFSNVPDEFQGSS